MAVLSCEPQDVEAALREAQEAEMEAMRTTKCLHCPKNTSHAYPIMGGHIIASYCIEHKEWLTPDLYNSTIAEMGCEPWQ